MVIAACISQKQGSELISYLKEHNLFDSQYASKIDGESLCFAVNKEFSLEGVTFKEVSQSFFPVAKRRQTLRDMLSAKIPANDLDKLKTAFDQVGQIAILEIDEEMRQYEHIIAESLLSLNSAIKTVLRKDGKHQGTFRSQPMKFIAGVNTKIASFVENGARMEVNVETVYFSSRLANERVRIANQVKDDETVLVLFAGASPQSIIIAKHANPKKVVSVEINPEGQKYAQINVAKNKCKNIELHCADVHEFAKVCTEKFDRIVMNLPKSAYEFLDDAFSLLNEEGTIHYYDFLHESEFDVAKKRVEDAAIKAGRKVTFNGIHTVGSQGIKTYRICVDCLIS